MGKVTVGREPDPRDEEAVEQVGAQVEESAEGTVGATEVAFDDAGFGDFAAAGTPVAGEFRCADCGYGAVVQRVLPRCPMCAGSAWEMRGPLLTRRID